MKLPLIEARAAETKLCTYCPKLCRPACPVSNVEGRETVTPWGKMRAVDEVGRGVAPPDVEHLAPSYACTGCLACTRHCLLDNPVADTLRDARGDAVANGTAPASVTAWRAKSGERIERVKTAASSLVARDGNTAYVPGCTHVVNDAAGVDRVAAGLDTLLEGVTTVGDACCGLPWLEAGDREGFMVRAEAFATRLRSFGKVVAGDAGCAHAMRVMYPTQGISLPAVEHLAETAAAHIGKLVALDDAPKGLAYHDACRLGRGLGVYEAPRAVLARVLGEIPGELPANRAHAVCSGGGGLLPVTSPATADAIAHEAAGFVNEVGAQGVVTTCAASRRRFERAGIVAYDFGELVARAVR